MRVLLDECVGWRLGRELVGHEVATVPQMGWAGQRNGQLLTLAAPHFDGFVTTDKNLHAQQNLSNHDIAVLVLRAPRTRLADLQLLVPELLRLLPTAPMGTATIVAL